MNAAILLADGFEEIEAVSVIDILRRVRIDLSVVGLHDVIKSSRNLGVVADIIIDKVQDKIFDAIILPGGLPGADNLKNSDLVKKMVVMHNDAQKLICAICAGPSVLSAFGILDGKKVTSYPSYEGKLGNVVYKQDNVVVDGNIVTSRGPGTACEFGFKIVELLLSEQKACQVKKAMLF